uniref:Uncharacterized protein n=1 Tax=Strigamia maritima TaxID=126957 RepID=T1INL9_STRMM
MPQIFTSEHKHWDRVIGNINFALHTAPSATTGITPAMATFLKELRPFWETETLLTTPLLTQSDHMTH